MIYTAHLKSSRRYVGDVASASQARIANDLLHLLRGSREKGESKLLRDCKRRGNNPAALITCDVLAAVWGACFSSSGYMTRGGRPSARAVPARPTSGGQRDVMRPAARPNAAPSTLPTPPPTAPSTGTSP